MNATVTTEIVKNDLCIGCGMCAALCPTKILAMKWNERGEYAPVAITSCITECGLCLKVCPFTDSGNNEDTIGKVLYGSIPKINHKPETGHYISAYAGHADEVHRAIGASGGIGTWLLEKLLEDGTVNYVICATPDEEPERLFSFKIFGSPEGVRTGAGSVYYPLEMSEVIKKILETPGKFAVVGLPCFIKAIRLAQMKNKKISDRISVTIGLVCGQMKSKYFTDYIASMAGVRNRFVAVRYRGKSSDRPVNNYYYTFIESTGESKKIYWNDGISEAWVNRWFTPRACNYCDDVFAECADAVCMDAWLPEYAQDCKGTSLMLIRSEAIAKLIEGEISSGTILLKTIPIEKIVESQAGVITNKRKKLSHRLYDDINHMRKAPVKRVKPVRPNNFFLDREMCLTEQMQTISKNLWVHGEYDIDHFNKVMQPYLKEIRRSKLISGTIMRPLQIIRKKMGALK